MKKIFFILGSCFFSINLFGQDMLPGYPQVLKAFFSEYAVENDAEDFVNFAKKKEGWFVQKINRIKNDSVLNERLFWSIKSKTYSNLEEAFSLQEDPEDAETKIRGYLSGEGAYLWNDYERCRYHGYHGWEEDMINDFEGQPHLPDTLLEGLSRAYSSLSNTYLWYQQGGRQDGKDTMQIVLKPLQMPSQKRIDKVIELINKSVNTYDRLLKQNPSYNTLVGNVHLKKFNECFHGYMQMNISMQDKEAKLFLEKAELSEQYITQAKNYLNSCDKNAILFSYGDNDTYQLWHVQEKENFRKDVAVINISMLGLPAYIDMLRKRKTVSFSTLPSFYGNPGSDVSYYKEPKDDIEVTQLSLKEYLVYIYSRKDSMQYIINGEQKTSSAYPTKNINLFVNTDAFNKIAGFKTMADNIPIKLSDYLYNNHLLMLDIINDNINKRPIYFTSSITDLFDDHLLQQGIVYRLFPMNPATKKTFLKKEISNLEKFADSVYKPVISFNLNNARNVSADGNNVFFQLYSRIADHYIEEGDIKKAGNWLTKVARSFTEVNTENMPMAYTLVNSLLKVDKEKAKRYMEIYGAYFFDKYTKPTATKGYISKQECLENLNSIKNYLDQQKIGSPLLDVLIKKAEAN